MRRTRLAAGSVVWAVVALLVAGLVLVGFMLLIYPGYDALSY